MLIQMQEAKPNINYIKEGEESVKLLYLIVLCSSEQTNNKKSKKIIKNLTTKKSPGPEVYKDEFHQIFMKKLMPLP